MFKEHIKGNKRGFTLVELLAVVLIVGILASIGLPLYQKFIMKARAAEAVNLLAMLRDKQTVSRATQNAYFSDYRNMPAGNLVGGGERISSSSQASNAIQNILTSGDYEVELVSSSNCAIARYKPDGHDSPEKFSFSISYLGEGLGCTGPICSSFPDIKGTAEGFCAETNKIVNNAITQSCPSNPGFNPGSCAYPQILSADRCHCVCPSNSPTAETCQSLGKTYNESTCSCSCDQDNVPAPTENPENYYFNEGTCQYVCKLTASTCIARGKVLNANTCSCEDPDTCPDGTVSVNGQCEYCNGLYWQVPSEENPGVMVGHCCTSNKIHRFTPIGDIDNYCTSPNSFNGETCSCECDKDKVTPPDPITGYTFNFTTCQYDHSCDLTAEICAEHDKLFDEGTCSCYCQTNESGGCICPDGKVSVNNECVYCNYDYYVSNGIGYCCTADAPYFNGTSCVSCPTGAEWDISTKQCVCTATNKVLNATGTQCVCDTANNWVGVVSQGTGTIENNCCDTSTSHYEAPTGNYSAICCEGKNTQAFTHYFTGVYYKKCCTPQKPYKRVNHAGTVQNPSIDDYCRVCPNDTDTVVNGQCQACPANTYAVFNTTLGYSECLTCGPHRIPNSQGTGCVCDTSSGWSGLVSQGTGTIENNCCDTSTSHYEAPTGNYSAICCEGKNTQAFTHYFTGVYYKKCCTPQKPYKRVNHAGTVQNPSIDDYCRVCPNDTDTVVNGQCQACPANTYAVFNTTLGYSECLTCGPHRIPNSQGTGCVCDTSSGWSGLVSQGTGTIENNCCDTSTSHYEAPTGNYSAICCEGKNTQAFTHYFTGVYYKKCCTPQKPYKRVNHAGTVQNPSIDDYCRVCPNDTDTIINGQCQPCPTGQVATFNTNLGYAECSCPSGTFTNAITGECETCAQKYGAGYTYTAKAGMTYQHCCDPNYAVDNNTANGCSQCPTGTTYSNNCGGCVCNNGYGLYDQTNHCTQQQCPVYKTRNNVCQCVCPILNDSTVTQPNGDNCCYCGNHDTAHNSYATTSPFFNTNGCYLGGNH